MENRQVASMEAASSGPANQTASDGVQRDVAAPTAITWFLRVPARCYHRLEGNDWYVIENLAVSYNVLASYDSCMRRIALQGEPEDLVLCSKAVKATLVFWGKNGDSQNLLKSDDSPVEVPSNTTSTQSPQQEDHSLKKEDQHGSVSQRRRRPTIVFYASNTQQHRTPDNTQDTTPSSSQHSTQQPQNADDSYVRWCIRIPATCSRRLVSGGWQDIMKLAKSCNVEVSYDPRKRKMALWGKRNAVYMCSVALKTALPYWSMDEASQVSTEGTCRKL